MTRSLQIILADDEIEIRQYFRRILVRMGHLVVGEARDGCELIELCRVAPPDLIITDIRMPSLQGLEAIAEINKYHNIPVIVVSSHDPPEQVVHHNIIKFLVKPINMFELQEAILTIEQMRNEYS